MSDAALEATERQFLSLLTSASDNFSIDLSLYSLPGILRNDATATRMSQFYSSTEELRNSQLDGVIVTGREPVTPNLADEAYWGSFTKLVDWAESNTYSSIWSCLAAHAAILYKDGIHRVRNGHKYSGIFDCVRVGEHPLAANVASRFKLPHSRWNGLKEEELAACGYEVITKAADAGVDAFVKDGKSLFVFFQGHPEYEPITLLLEYRRDIGRYVRGESKTYPWIPCGYFDGDTTTALMALEKEAKAGSRAELLARTSKVLERARIEKTWHSAAVGIYRNWLEIISARKKLQMERNKVTLEPSGAEGVPPLVTLEASQSSIYGAPSTALVASRNMPTIL